MKETETENQVTIETPQAQPQAEPQPQAPKQFTPADAAEFDGLSEIAVRLFAAIAAKHPKFGSVQILVSHYGSSKASFYATPNMDACADSINSESLWGLLEKLNAYNPEVEKQNRIKSLRAELAALEGGQ